MIWDWRSSLAFFACWLVSLGAFEGMALLSGNPTVSQALWRLWLVLPWLRWALAGAFVVGAAVLFRHLFLSRG